MREIDEAVNRRKNTENHYTFHGRDVYAYTGARLAAGVITFEQVGRLLPAQVVTIPYEKARYEDGVAYGNVQTLDGTYGNLWSNIDRATLDGRQLKIGDPVRVSISERRQDRPRTDRSIRAYLRRSGAWQALALPEQPRQRVARHQPGQFRRINTASVRGPNGACSFGVDRLSGPIDSSGHLFDNKRAATWPGICVRKYDRYWARPSRLVPRAHRNRLRGRRVGVAAGSRRRRHALCRPHRRREPGAGRRRHDGATCIRPPRFRAKSAPRCNRSCHPSTCRASRTRTSRTWCGRRNCAA